MSATTTIVTGGTAPRDVPPARRGFDWGQPFVYLVALVIAAIAVGPVIYVFMGGLRTTADINANPAGLPDPWTLENWIAVLSAPRFWGNVFASVVLAAGTTLGVVIVGIMAAFVIARYDFRGRQGLYTLFTAGLMFPLTVAALPLTLLLRTLGLHGTYLGVIIPSIAFALPTTIIILVPFLRAIPDELEEAASIDGASRLGFFWRILLPLSMPGLVTVGVLAFVGTKMLLVHTDWKIPTTASLFVVLAILGVGIVLSIALPAPPESEKTLPGPEGILDPRPKLGRRSEGRSARE